MTQSIPSALIPPPPRAFIGYFFTSPSPRWGTCQRSAQGGALLKNNSVSIGSSPIVSTCEREMTERRKFTVRERVVVLAVKSDFSYYRSYKNAFSCVRLFFLVLQVGHLPSFRSPHHGAFVHVSWRHRGTFATILKSKDKCPSPPGG